MTLRLTTALRVLVCALALAPGAQAQQEPPPYRALLALQLGYLHHVRGDYQRATELFRESIAIRPSAEGHTYLGWSLSYLNRLEEAIAECRTAIRLDPDFGNPYNDIGVYLIALGRRDEAAPWLERAIASKRYCCYHFPYTNLGRLHLEQGRIAAAKRAFERALELEPDYAPAHEGLEIIRARGLRDL